MGNVGGMKARARRAYRSAPCRHAPGAASKCRMGREAFAFPVGRNLGYIGSVCLDGVNRSPAAWTWSSVAGTPVARECAGGHLVGQRGEEVPTPFREVIDGEAGERLHRDLLGSLGVTAGMDLLAAGTGAVWAYSIPKRQPRITP